MRLRHRSRAERIFARAASAQGRLACRASPLIEDQGKVMASSDNPADSRTLELMVRQIRFEGRGINSYEFVDPSGELLPAFTAGAHIDVHVKDGFVRQYS